MRASFITSLTFLVALVSAAPIVVPKVRTLSLNTYICSQTHLLFIARTSARPATTYVISAFSEASSFVIRRSSVCPILTLYPKLLTGFERGKHILHLYA